MKRNFTFNRPVQPAQASVISDRVQDIIGNPRFIKLQKGPKLIILNDRQLTSTKNQKRLMFHPSVFEASRGRFGKSGYGPWEHGEIAVTGVRALGDVLALVLDKPDWLINERNTIKKVAGIRDNSTLSNSDYTPHVTIGRFVGDTTELGDFYNCETLLKKKLDIANVAIGPLHHISDDYTWVLTSRIAADQVPIAG